MLHMKLNIEYILSVKTSSSPYVKMIKNNNGNVSSESTQMSNIFNDYFVNVAENIADKIPKTLNSPLAYKPDQNPN